MFIWNMDTNSFDNTSNYAYNLQSAAEFETIIPRFYADQTLCVFNINSNPAFIAKTDRSYYQIMASMDPNGTIFYHATQIGVTINVYVLFLYDVVLDVWNKTDIGFNTDRDNYGCTMVQNSIYVMGGKYDRSGLEAQFIEKCDFDGFDPHQITTCDAVGYMDYRRSQLQLTS